MNEEILQLLQLLGGPKGICDGSAAAGHLSVSLCRAQAAPLDLTQMGLASPSLNVLLGAYGVRANPEMQSETWFVIAAVRWLLM